MEQTRQELRTTLTRKTTYRPEIRTLYFHSVLTAVSWRSDMKLVDSNYKLRNWLHNSCKLQTSCQVRFSLCVMFDHFLTKKVLPAERSIRIPSLSSSHGFGGHLHRGHILNSVKLRWSPCCTKHISHWHISNNSERPSKKRYDLTDNYHARFNTCSRSFKTRSPPH